LGSDTNLLCAEGAHNLIHPPHEDQATLGGTSSVPAETGNPV